MYSPVHESIFSIQEYEEDGIDWTKVEFEDNQECLDLIEKVIYGSKERDAYRLL